MVKEDAMIRLLANFIPGKRKPVWVDEPMVDKFGAQVGSELWGPFDTAQEAFEWGMAKSKRIAE